MSTLKELKLEDIRENPVALREVNRKTEKYEELVQSIKQRGILNAIVVRSMKDAESGDEYYGLVDGLHRYNAAMDAGLKSIPCNVLELTDGETLEAQIISNIQRIETRPIEYTQQLQRMMAHDPTLTITQLGVKLGKSNSWISERLNLMKIDEKIQPLVDEGKINLSNAFALARLPLEEQVNFVEMAQTESPQEFLGKVQARKKEIAKAKREGREVSDPTEFTAPVVLRKASEIKDEHAKSSIGPALVKKTGIKTPDEGFAMGVAWALQQDPVSVELAKEKDEQRKAEAADKREKAKLLKKKKKAEEALVKAERLKLESKLMDEGKTSEEIDKELAIFDEANSKKN
jgi:ParB family chromosome partitioning protein